MNLEIRQAEPSDGRWIVDLHRAMSRPLREGMDCSEYWLALSDERRVGCAGVSLLPDGGYLYGLSVLKSYRSQGIGAALTEARVERVRAHGGSFAFALAMFWNVRFFRRLGFDTFPRKDLPETVLRLSDLSNPLYRRSAVLLKRLDGEST